MTKNCRSEIPNLVDWKTVAESLYSKKQNTSLQTEKQLRSVSFTVPATPRAQPRQKQTRITTKTGRTFQHNYTPADAPVQTYKATIRLVAAQHWKEAPLTGAVELHATFILPRPTTKIRKRKPNPRERHIKKPDMDNLLKALVDALTGIIWHDDRQISDVVACKRIASADEQPRVEIEVIALESKC